MAAEEEIVSSTLQADLNRNHDKWKHEMEVRQLHVDVLQARLQEIQTYTKESEEDRNSETKILSRRVRLAATLLTYLKSKARVMAIPDLAYESCGIKESDGLGLVDRNGNPLSRWFNDVDLSSSDSPDVEAWIGISGSHDSLEEQDSTYTGELLQSVKMVGSVMEALVKRAVLAETEAKVEKKKVSLGKEEIIRKTVQMQTMLIKLEEMERFTFGTNSILTEMKQRVDDLVEETYRQRQRAAENEEELCRVKLEFESLKLYVNSLINVRETLVSSEKKFQTIERLFERSVCYNYFFFLFKFVNSTKSDDDVLLCDEQTHDKDITA